MALSEMFEIGEDRKNGLTLSTKERVFPMVKTIRDDFPKRLVIYMLRTCRLKDISLLF
jgi:hypothetical protein